MACAVGNSEGAASASTAPASTAPANTASASGVDVRYVDESVRPQDDLYRHMHGKWLDTFQIPDDKGSYGAFTKIDDDIQDQLHGIVDSLSDRNRATPENPNAAEASVDAGKIAALYASFMDEARLETLGAAPLADSFAGIDALADKKGIATLIAHFNKTGAGAPFDISIDPDSKDSTHYAVSLHQSGLGLPDRDYYLSDDAKFKEIRAQYVSHVQKMLALAGIATAASDAPDILKLETALANLQWTRVANRDPVATYNKVAVADLSTIMPGFDWRSYLEGAAIAGKADHVILRQPSYLKGLDKLIADTPLGVWKSYFKWHQLSAAAPFLSKAFVDERFAFMGTTLRGVPQNLPRWKRGVSLVDGAIGEALGRLYVEKYFPPQHKARMEALVRNLLETYRRDIVTLDWMSPQTKVGAQAKLAKIVTKIGYPNTWRDYSALTVNPDDLWGNVLRTTAFEYQRGVDKLGKPIDRDEWFMTPQTVNAYYNPVMNEIVFPAAILQPPFFDANADDAVNYGGIVAVIGHEVSHGFDDKGSQYDADGNLHDWFTKEDHDKFAAKTQALVAQYNAYEPVAGFHVNGELTLGENIGDNSGLAIAYKAYRLSLAGKKAPVIGGFTGDQRFFLGWVQVWRGKTREAEAIQRIKTDPHSPPAVRGIAPLENQPGFFTAFGVKPGDRMYRAPPQRVTIW